MNHIHPAGHRPTRSARILRSSSACLAALLIATWVSGCVYRVSIQQGNYLDEDAVEQVVVGMTRNQVRYVLGTPLVADTFHEDRWDYYYYLKQGKSRKVETRHFVVFFEGDSVSATERRDAT